MGGIYNVSPTVLLTLQLPHGLTQGPEHIRNNFKLSPQNGDERFVARGIRPSLLGVLGAPRVVGSQELNHRV